MMRLRLKEELTWYGFVAFLDLRLENCSDEMNYWFCRIERGGVGLAFESLRLCERLVSHGWDMTLLDLLRIAQIR